MLQANPSEASPSKTVAMVYLNTLAEINNAFAHMVGCCDYADASNRPDGQTALQLAQLQPGESILELGAGSGRLMAEAKQSVGAGFCVAVDAVQGFLDTAILWALNNKGLTVYPATVRIAVTSHSA
jgi:protein-L-isoaspartate O-methyltransferase